jgi:rhodanese-related sulfurtransferase
MRKFVFLIIALLVGVLSAFGASGYRNLMSTEARKLVEQKKNLYLLDVRTQDEFRQAHLKGSVLIPINEIERRLGEVPRNRPILVLCAVGSRSNLVAGFLSSKGYGEVYNMQDGLMGWYRNGYPIER